MGINGKKVSCADCHDAEKIGRQVPFSNIRTIETDSYSLLSAGDGKEHIIPLLKHPAHKKYGKLAGCQVCHAQWSFNDYETHLLRNDLDEYEDFSRLSVQGSFEVEQTIKNNLNFETEDMPHTMTDKLNGQAKEGLWYKGYKTRRWEEVIIDRDEEGRLQVMRPLLDIYLSWIDADETVRFDSLRSNAKNNGLTPYVPHTTGKAGMFYIERMERGLRSKNGSAK